MSWIFTIVFSGLLFSSNAGSAVSTPDFTPVPETAANAVRQDETERFEQTYPLNANGRVSVSNVNGSIVAEAWDRNEVKLVAVKTADTKERLTEVEVKVTASADSFSVETNYDDWKKKNGGDRWRNGGKLTVDYQLMVPRGAVLNEVGTVNGSVTVSDFTNLTKISAVNGTVKATDLRGTADLSTVNGDVIADFNSLDAGSKISLETVNGRVELMIPSDSNATVKADSLNGNISNDLGLPVRKGRYVGRDLYGRIGNGDVRIKLNSVNGDLKVSRKNDNKQLNPVVNLLTQKEKEDEDWESDAEAAAVAGKTAANMSKINREVAAAMKNSAKVSVAAMADVQKEMARIKPEIERAAADVMRSAEVQNAIRDGVRQSAAAVARVADAAFFPAMPRIEKKSESFPMKGVPRVTVNAHGCAVKVIGWDRSDVQYSVTQFSERRNRKPVEIKESHTDTTMDLTVQNGDADAAGGDMFGGLSRTRIEVYVPRKTNLKISTDGEIRLEGVSGEVDLTGEDQSINVRDVDGKLKITNADGVVRVIGFKGELVGRTEDGSMNLEGEFSKLSADGDTGNFVVTLSETAAARIYALSENVKVDGLQLELVKSGEAVREYRLGDGQSEIKVTTGGEITLRGQNALRAGI